jgi:plastocyanin
MSQQADTGLTQEVRFHLPLPIVIPLGALLVIALGTFGFSRILLNVPKEVAVIIALAVAANLLGALAFIALRPETARAFWAELFIVATYPIVIGAVLAMIGLGTGHATEDGGTGGEPAAPAAGTVSAEGVQFDTAEISLAAGEEEEITFNNADTVEHNISIYEEEGGKNLFTGDIIPGGQETTYSVPALDKGEYYFQCDVHPAMNGTVKVA